MRRFAGQVVIIAMIAMALAVLFNRSLSPPLPLFTAYEQGDLLSDEAAAPDNVTAAILDRIDLELLVLLIEGGDVVLIDARRRDEYEQAHIPGALSLPLGHFQEYYPRVSDRLSGDKTIVVYCAEATCPDAAGLARKLLEMGHDSLKVFKGGMAEWNRHQESYIEGGADE